MVLSWENSCLCDSIWAFGPWFWPNVLRRSNPTSDENFSLCIWILIWKKKLKEKFERKKILFISKSKSLKNGRSGKSVEKSFAPNFYVIFWLLVRIWLLFKEVNGSWIVLTLFYFFWCVFICCWYSTSFCKRFRPVVFLLLNACRIDFHHRFPPHLWHNITETESQISHRYRTEVVQQPPRFWHDIIVQKPSRRYRTEVAQ